MTVYETDLPGVGKKFEVELDGERRLVVVIHNTGRREVFVRPEPDADAEKLFDLSDRLARQVGTILEGAYFQPIRTDSIETVLSDDALIEWVNVGPESPFVGGTLAETRLREEIGVSVVAIQRGEETITNPGPDTEIGTDDTLVVLGSRDACRRLHDLAAGDRTLDDDPDDPDAT
ncbi:cation:proton antiporter regulatory subunit [Halococcus saccharolyticus]|uniref:Potassium/proton antiporter regulatory subunit, cpa2 family protein n=1 Tax=Halococcus saccharolyticus DSM 5350 TaxID=1227455 RepID=M0MAG6_9EURY|nr:TrkA C-terminal domain-containing protein [Halococcus saccharolyticus]EMA42741.1 potassium/proton antiporter regulatory subunit, cpa2 family protein [Halococcus saccharolyticus DSM 5350]